MRAVVVGGAGFIGGAIADELIVRNADVAVVDIRGDQQSTDRRHGTGAVEHVVCDIRDLDRLTSALAGADEVYHLAGKLGTSELNDEIPEAVATNIVGSMNVFEAAVRSGVGRVFNAAKPNVWRNAYSVTKEAAERLALLYDSLSDSGIVSLRYFNAFGPTQAVGPVRKIIPTFAVQARAGVPISVYGSGEQTVDLIYVRDLARITVDVVRSDARGVVPDCGTGVALTVNEAARAVNEYFENDAGIEHLPMRVGEVDGTELVADTTLLTSIVGEIEFTSFHTALAATLDWYERIDLVEPGTRPYASA